jgi:hypothetical protein
MTQHIAAHAQGETRNRLGQEGQVGIRAKSRLIERCGSRPSIARRSEINQPLLTQKGRKKTEAGVGDELEAQAGRRRVTLRNRIQEEKTDTQCMRSRNWTQEREQKVTQSMASKTRTQAVTQSVTSKNRTQTVRKTDRQSVTSKTWTQTEGQKVIQEATSKTGTQNLRQEEQQEAAQDVALNWTQEEEQKGQEVWKEEFLRNLVFMCWFQYHYQRLLFAYQVQQRLLFFFYQQYMSATTVSSNDTKSHDTSSEPASTPTVIPPQTIIMHPLPFPGAPGAPPTFSGRNVTSFLKKYESMCDNYQIDAAARLKRVAEYCEDGIAWELEAFDAWIEKDWEKLKTEMLHEWRRQDPEQLMHTRAFLEEYVRKPRGKEGLKHYYRQFNRISKVLMDRKELDSYSQGRLFIIGLPEDIRYEVLSE